MQVPPRRGLASWTQANSGIIIPEEIKTESVKEIETENGIEIVTGSGSGPEIESGSGITVQLQVCSIGGYLDQIRGFCGESSGPA